MNLVLAANPNVQSGHTTLLAAGALLASHTMTVIASNDLYFGESASSSARRGRRLSASSGNLDVLAVRVTTNDGALTRTAAQISDKVFGTDGDVVNFKSSTEDCSADAATINPASGTGSSPTCVDGGAFYAAGTDGSGALADCTWFGLYSNVCADYGTWADITGRSGTANSECCTCGGGTYSHSYAPVVDGVIDLYLNTNAVGLDRFYLEDLAENYLEGIFSVSDLGTIFDNIMIFVPEGTFRDSDSSTAWIAYAYVGGFISVYNGDDQVAAANTHLHEGESKSNESINACIDLTFLFCYMRITVIIIIIIKRIMNSRTQLGFATCQW